MKELYFIFVTSWLLCWGCSSPLHEEKSTAVQGLLKRNNTLSQRLASAFPSDFSEKRLAMMQTELVIKNKYVSDTIDRAFAKEMNDFKLNRKSIGKLNKAHLVLKKTLSDEKVQLTLLLEDIQLGRGDQEKHQRFIDQEVRNLNTLEKSINEFISKLKVFQDKQRQLDANVSPMAKQLLNP
ncbi:MAG: hypothetical protein ACKO4K_00850 [Flavobacteriales bacterium]